MGGDQVSKERVFPVGILYTFQALSGNIMEFGKSSYMFSNKVNIMSFCNVLSI